MSNREGGGGHARLREMTSLKDIFEVAVEFEKTARDFYTALIPRVSKNIRYLVEELAEEEQQHVDLFSQMAARDDLEQQLKTEIQKPVNDHKFSDCVHLPDMGENPDDQAVLQYALMREHAAMEQYHSLANDTEPGPIHDLFLFIANEETKHKNELEKIYYEIVHRGGGV